MLKLIKNGLLALSVNPDQIIVLDFDSLALFEIAEASKIYEYISKILKTQEKFYVSDISIIYATLGNRDRMISGILENIVFLELKRRGYRVFVGKLGSSEIDFVAEKRGTKMYVQVTYKLESEETIKREFGNLLSINDQYPKYVVSMDERWKESIEGIKHLTVQEFLLSDSY